MKSQHQRVGVFVDASNLYHSAKHLFGARADFGKVLETAVGERQLIRSIAYVIKAQNPEEEKFFNALLKQGFEVKVKDLQVFAGGQKKGDWDVGLAIDAIRLSPKLDVAVLASGDGDFVPLLEYLKHHGLIVEVMAFGESASLKLKEAADEFIDLSKDTRRFLRDIRRR